MYRKTSANMANAGTLLFEALYFTYMSPSTVSKRCCCLFVWRTTTTTTLSEMKSNALKTY